MFSDQMFTNPVVPTETADDEPIGFAVSRRRFLGGSGGLLLAVTLAPVAGCTTSETDSPLHDVRGGDATPSLWVAIDRDGVTTITCHRAEMGQQVWTSLAQIVADELDADWDTVRVVQSVGHPRYGDQNTDGSRSVRRNLHRLRVAGAAMRSMLVSAGAERWGVSADACRSELGVVYGPDGQTASYGELADAAARVAVPSEQSLRLKSRGEWRYIGKGVPSLTVPMITRGEGTFGQDIRLPDMVYAVIARPPELYATLASVDDSETLKVPGVLRTVRLPELEPPASFRALGGIAVIAEDTWSAMRGRDALKLEWKSGPNRNFNSDDFEAELVRTAQQPGAVRRDIGDVETGLKTAARTVTADYYVPLLAHASMEPPAAAARWDGERVEVWGCVQVPQGTRRAVAGACGLDEDEVTVNVTWLGGAFGRKSKPDFVVEAALVAREVGRPVKVVWTREDDLRHDYYHTVSAQHLEGGLDEGGACTAFLHRTVFPPIGSTFSPDNETPSAGELGLGAADTPFAVSNLRLESGDARGHVRIGWLRSVSNIYHAFAVQSFACELAHAAGRDPKDYLLDLIGPPRHIDPNEQGGDYGNYGDSLEEYPIDTGRLANVARIAADMAGWGRSMPHGSGLGIAVHRSFLTYVATVVEVNVDAEGRLSIPMVWTAVDAGTVVNPRHTTAQMEGGTLFGLSNALYGEITARDGVIEQANFPDWRLMRMQEAPRDMAVHIVDSDAPPGGVGEPGTPPAAPALANAIFAATGVRIRRLPVFGRGSNDRIEPARGDAA